MNDIKNIVRKKGGRPKQSICRDQQLCVMCTKEERKIIEDKASEYAMSNSEFLRTLALKGHLDRIIKTLPKEILVFTGTLNHLAANINQIAKKRNSFDELNAIERAELNVLTGQVKQVAKDIKNYLYDR